MNLFLRSLHLSSKIFLLLLLSAIGLINTSIVLAQNESYTLNEGDVISISVWGEENMDRNVLVLPDGSISFPLAGSIDVSELSAQDVERAIAEGLEKYIPDSDVSVVVVSTEGNRIYIAGQVNVPGSYMMSGPMTVIQALSEASGLTIYAEENKIRIIRHNGTEQMPLQVNYKDILSGKDLSTNYQLEAGDTIVVP